MNFLVVDDYEATAQTLKVLLEKIGHTATAVYSAEEAFKACDCEKFDVVILDYILPGTNGLQVLKGLRKTTGCHCVPVILSSAIDAESAAYLRRDIEDYKPASFIRKPYIVTELMEEIDKLKQ